MFGTILWVLGGVVLFFVIWRVGVVMLRGVTTPLPGRYLVITEPWQDMSQLVSKRHVA